MIRIRINAFGRRVATGALVLMLGPSVAWGQCDAPYTMGDMLGHVNTVGVALADGDMAATTEAGKAIDAGLPCMSEILPSQFAGTAIRSAAAGLISGGDEADKAKAKKWLITSSDIESTHDYGVGEVPDGHPLLAIYREAKSLKGGDVVNMEAAFKPGKHYLDGRLIQAPEARMDRLHLYQWKEEGGGVKSWVIDGNAFPADVVVSSDAVAGGDDGKKDKKEKKKKKDLPPTGGDENGEFFQTVKTNVWPTERVILTAGGGALLSAGAVTYAMSLGANNDFSTAKTQSEVEDLKGKTNLLFITSSALTAAGAGALGFSALFFIIDGEPAGALRVRF